MASRTTPPRSKSRKNVTLDSQAKAKKSNTLSPFGRRVKAALAELRWTQRILSERTGVTENAISQYISGRIKEPAADPVLRIANALGKRGAWLLWGELPESDPSHAKFALDIKERIDAGAEGSLSLNALQRVLRSRDLLVHFNMKEVATLEWMVISDLLLFPTFLVGDRLLVDRKRNDLNEGWMALEVRNLVCVRKVLAVEQDRVVLASNEDAAPESFSPREVRPRGRVIGRISAFE